MLIIKGKKLDKYNKRQKKKIKTKAIAILNRKQKRFKETPPNISVIIMLEAGLSFSIEK